MQSQQETNQRQRSEGTEWTEREIELAENHGVEPKTVRLLNRIIEDKLTGINDAVGNLIREVTGEQTEGEHQPEQAKPEEQFTADLAEARVKKWLLSQSSQTKLAVVLMHGFCIDDHGTKELWEEVIDTYEENVINVTSEQAENLSNEDMFMSGVCGELLIWRKHY